MISVGIFHAFIFFYASERNLSFGLSVLRLVYTYPRYCVLWTRGSTDKRHLQFNADSEYLSREVLPGTNKTSWFDVGLGDLYDIHTLRLNPEGISSSTKNK